MTAGCSVAVSHNGNTGIGSGMARSLTHNLAFGGAPMPHSATVTEAGKSNTVPTACDMSRLAINVSVNTATLSVTGVLRKNGANTSVQVSISAGATGTFEDTTNTASFSAGDAFCLQFVIGAIGLGNTVTLNWFRVKVAQTTGNAVSFFSATGLGGSRLFRISAASTTNYVPIGGEGGALVTTTDADDTTRPPVAIDGTASRLRASITANARTSTTTINFRKNGANGNQTLSIGSGATGVFEDTSNTDSVAFNDRLGYSIVTGTGTGNIDGYMICCAIQGSNDEWCTLGLRAENAVSGTNYQSNAGSTRTAATEAGYNWTVPFATNVNGITLRAGFGSGTHTITARVAGADTSVVATRPTGGSTNPISDTSHTASVADGDTVGAKTVLANASNLKAGCLRFINNAVANARRIVIVFGGP